jgi:glyoxylate carboligase
VASAEGLTLAQPGDACRSLRLDPCSKSMPTVAEQFVQVLRQAGVERIYGVVGDSLNPIVDAVRRIEWVHVRNEETGASAAAAEAQLTGRLAVCAAVAAQAIPT